MARRASYHLHLIAHLRAPREHDQPFETTRIAFARTLDSLLDRLAQSGDVDIYPLRALLLDGQSSLIEDYLALRPDRFDLVEQLVRDGKLWLGPWYVLPHSLLVSGEGLIRNLSLGLRTARLFGPALNTAYLPNGSGQPSQLPQLLSGFRLESAVLLRGITDQPSEFAWEGPDGSRLTVLFWRAGLDPLASTPLADVRAMLSSYSLIGHLIIPLQLETTQVLDRLPNLIAAGESTLPDSIFQSTLPAFLNAIQAVARDLPLAHGELRSPAHTALDQASISSRGWVKQRLHAVETLLTRWVEPFGTWAALTDLEPRYLPLRHAALERAWRLVSQNHAPETLGGLASDNVYPDVRQRFDQAEQIGKVLITEALPWLAAQVDTSAAPGQALIVFNPGSTAHAGLVDEVIRVPADWAERFRIVDWHGDPVIGTRSTLDDAEGQDTRPFRVSFVAPEVPPLGLTTFFVVPGVWNSAPLGINNGQVGLENERLRAVLDMDALTVTLTDKLRQVTYYGVVDVQVEGDVGDARSTNPVGGAIVVNRRLADTSAFISRSPERERVGYRIVLTLEPTADMLPSGAENITLAVDVELTLWRNGNQLDVRLVVDNPLANYRLRLHCPLPFTATSALYEMPFDLTARLLADLPPISPPTGWAESPLSSGPQGAFTAVIAAGDALNRPGLIVANRGLREADVFASERDSRSPTELAITVLRSISHRQRPDVITRASTAAEATIHPERAADLEQRGPFVAELSLIPTDAQSLWADCGAAWAFSEGSLRTVITRAHPGALPTHASLIRASTPTFRISAVKMPDDPARGGCIVRGYNITDSDQAVTLKPWRTFALVDVIRLDEVETGGRLALDSDGSISFRAAPHRILTFWFHD